MSNNRLSANQRAILGIAVDSETPLGGNAFKGLNGRGATLTGAINSLLKRGFLKEVRVKASATHWRKDDHGCARALAITANGLRALDVKHSTQGNGKGPASGPRPDTKRARLIEMLSRDPGICVAELSSKLGWLPHTVRAAMTRLRQQGYRVERSREVGVSTYRITSHREVA